MIPLSHPPGQRSAERLALRRDGKQLQERLRVPPDLAFLEGHFPGHPLVAGVVQVHFAMAALEEILGQAPRLETLEGLKFRELLLPDQEVLLKVEMDEESGGFAFSLVDASHPARVFSSGRGRLATGPRIAS